MLGLASLRGVREEPGAAVCRSLERASARVRACTKRGRQAVSFWEAILREIRRSKRVGEAHMEKAFVLRITLGEIDSIQLALDTNTIIIGWSKAASLLDETLDWEHFRQALIEAYPTYRSNVRSAGNAAGNMWRFIRDMKVGDLVVVPHGTNFFVAQVQGPAFHVPEKVEEDTAFRRNVTWLNDKKPIPRTKAPSALYSRMKIQGVSANAYDLVGDIRSVLDGVAAGIETTFAEQLSEKLAAAALEQMRRGFMNER